MKIEGYVLDEYFVLFFPEERAFYTLEEIREIGNGKNGDGE